MSDLNAVKIDDKADHELYRTVHLLKRAITHWPTDVKTLETFVREVENFLHTPDVTLDLIAERASRVNLDEVRQMESLASLRELLSIHDDETLEGVVQKCVQKIG